MRISATELINFTEDLISSSLLRLNTIRIESELINQLRFRIRSLYSSLLQSESEVNRPAYLGLELLKLQSSPVVPDLNLLARCGLGKQDHVLDIWGPEVFKICEEIEQLLCWLNDDISPFIGQSKDLILSDVERFGVSEVKIWSHRNEIRSFIDEFEKAGVELREENFICSLSDYKDSCFFESFYRFGPFRSSGWSKVPQALVSSVRYKRITQFLWDSSFNEEDFFKDPVIRNINYLNNFKVSDKLTSLPFSFAKALTTEQSEAGDDFKFLLNKPLPKEKHCTCILVECSGDKGVLLTPNSEQLVYRREDDSFAYLPAKAIVAGDFLLLYTVNVDTGGLDLSSEALKLAPLWKNALKDMYSKRYSFLVSKLKDVGIGLSDLDRAVNEWMKNHDGNVVHGPQRQRHFQLLIEKVLPECLGNGYTWMDAWQEIQHSRVGAIKHGRLESSLADEELLSHLESNKNSFRSLSEEKSHFAITLDDSTGLSGVINFFLVCDVSTDFKAPEGLIGAVYDISGIEAFCFLGTQSWR